MVQIQPFKLSSSLKNHTSDVRAVTSITSPGENVSTIISASRDSTIRIYNRSEGSEGSGSGGGWKEDFVLVDGHQGYISALATGVKDGQAYLLSSGIDTLIQFWPLTPTPATKPSHTLLGHSQNVCALAVSEDGRRAASGSWDSSAILWSLDTFSPIATLRGHSAAIWGILIVHPTSYSPEEYVLTASADTTIKKWCSGREVATFKGHSQPVRALALLPESVGGGGLFASAGNDGTIRIWTVGGESISVLHGHQSFVYTLSVLPDGELVSGGEDRTVRVWSSDHGSLTQTISLPCLSIWSVRALPSGDIVSGSSDAYVRVFSRSQTLWESQEKLKEWEAEVASTAINPNQVGDVKKSDLPGSEALEGKGKKDGEVKMVKTDTGEVEAHQWSEAEGVWFKIGSVVDAVGSGRKQLYEGIEYDYVFDVDVKEGSPPLKLPFNASENPYVAAQKFLQKNELPLEYIDQVVQFIEKNTGGVSIGSGSSNNFVDPYTGATRYQPSQAQGGTSSGGNFSDPYTGATRYQPTTAPPPTNNTGFTGDPFTGSGAYSTFSSTASASLPANLLPHRTMLSFTQAPNFTALKSKIISLNSESDPKLSDTDLINLDGVILFLTAASQAKGLVEKEPIQGQLEVIAKLLNWGEDVRFPGLDIARLYITYSPSMDILPLLLSTLHPSTSSKASTNYMLCLRGLSNILISTKGQVMVTPVLNQIVDALGRTDRSKLDKNGKVALVTVVLNLSVINLNRELSEHCLSRLIKICLESLHDDPETVYRSLVAFGNLASSHSVKKYLGTLEKEKATVVAMTRGSSEQRIIGLVKEIHDLK